MSDSNPPKVASENTLREQMLNAMQSSYSPDNLLDQLMQAFTAVMETVISPKGQLIPWKNEGERQLITRIFDGQLQRLAEMVGKK